MDVQKPVIRASVAVVQDAINVSWGSFSLLHLLLHVAFSRIFPSIINNFSGEMFLIVCRRQHGLLMNITQKSGAFWHRIFSQVVNKSKGPQRKEKENSIPCVFPFLKDSILVLHMCELKKRRKFSACRHFFPQKSCNACMCVTTCHKLKQSKTKITLSDR